MKDRAYYEANPWDRSDDISILRVYRTGPDRIETLAEFDGLIEAPNWSKDGQALFFNRNGRIVRYDLKNGAQSEIDSGYADNCNNDHVPPADGRMIAVSHGTREDGQSRVYILPLSGGTPRLVTPLAPNYLHGWSPDGRTLAYCAARKGKYDIYTLPAEGGVEKRLTDAPGLNDGPEYSPDGAYIWFNSDRSGLMQVWRMRADGSEQTQITFDEERNSWFPHISPDGKQVVFLCYRRGDLKPSEHLPHKHVELRLMNADGTGIRTLHTLFGGQGTINVNSWSPDGKAFAFVEYRIRGIDGPA